MPFGKFKGLELADLPNDYLEWLVGLGDLREPLRSEVEREYRWRTGVDAIEPSSVRDAATEIVSAGYRVMATRCHPDHGGDTRAMQAVNNARDWLRGQLRSLPA